MRQLHTENADRDLHYEAVVLTHTLADTPAVQHLYVEIRLGDGTKNIAGNGAYRVRATVGGVEVFRSDVLIAVGVTRRILDVEFLARGGEAVALLVTGLAADTDVDVTAYLYDASVDVSEVDANVVKLGGAEAPLAALKAMLDGTGGVTLTLQHLDIIAEDGWPALRVLQFGDGETVYVGAFGGGTLFNLDQRADGAATVAVRSMGVGGKCLVFEHGTGGVSIEADFLPANFSSLMVTEEGVVRALSHEGNALALASVLAAVKAKADLLGTARLTVTSPVSEDGQVETMRADSYRTAHGRALVWTLADYTGPITAETPVELRLMTLDAFNEAGGTAALVKDAEVSREGTTLTVTVELDGSDTALLEASPPAERWAYRYQLVATVDGDPLTLAAGAWDLGRHIPGA